jgi:PAS domain S-box-containing protein
VGLYLNLATPAEREQIYRTIVESAQEGVWVVDAGDRTTFVNPKMAALLGYAADEMLGVSPLAFLDELDAELYLARAARLRQGLADDLDLRYRRKDGSRIWALLRVSPLFDSQGEYAGALAMATDISARKQAEELQAALSTINQAINSTLDGAEIMQRVTFEAARALASETASIMLREEQGWVVRYAYGFDADVVGRVYLDRDAQHAVLAAQVKDLVVVDDAQEDRRIQPELAQTYHIRSFLVVPLIMRGDVIGVSFFNHHSHAVPFSPAQLDFARQLAAALSLALENARLYQAEQAARLDLEQRVMERTASLAEATQELERSNASLSARASQMAALAAISQALAEAGFDSEALLDTIAHWTAEVIGDSCAISQVSADGSLLAPTAVYHRDPEALPFLRQVYAPAPGRPNLTLSQQVVQTGQSVLVPVVPEADQRAVVPAELHGYLARFGIHSVIVVPMRARGRVIGTLAVARDVPGRSYTPEDQTFLQALADRAALAILGAELYRQLAEANQALSQREAALYSTAARLQAEIAERARAEAQLVYQAHVLANVTDAVYATDAEFRITAWNHAAEELFGIPAGEAVGRLLNDVLAGAFLDPDEQTVAKIVGETGRYRGQIRYDRRDGTSIISETTGMILRDESGAVAGYIGVNRDITKRKQIEAQRDASLQALARQTERLQIVHDIDRAVLAARAAHEISQIGADRVRQLVACDRAVVMQFDWERREVERLAVAGQAQPGKEPGTRLAFDAYGPLGTGELGQIHVVPDLRVDESGWPLLHDLHALGFLSFVAIPMAAKGQLIGHLNLLSTQQDAFSIADLEVARQVGDSLAVALHNAQLFAQVELERRRHQALAHRLVEVQEGERRTIARELHDEAGQALTSLMMGLGLLKQEATRPEAVIARAQELQATVNDVMEGLHRLAVNLRPATLDRLGLVPALKQHVEAFRMQSGLDVALVILEMEDNGSGLRLAPEVEITLYRIIQEALTNVARHARAGRVDIVLKRQATRLTAIIEDNGIGLDLEAALAQGRLGIFGMRERAEMLGGTLEVESTPGHGTTIFVEVPYTVTSASEPLIPAR